jgi:hypothetical protein
VWWARHSAALQFRGRAAALAIPGLLLFLLVGVSGAIAALGDTLFPVHSLAEGLRQDFDPAASFFLRLRLLHPILAVATGTWLLFYGFLYRRWALMTLVASQIAAGALNLLWLAPIWMQMVHLLLADLVWIALVVAIGSSLQDLDLSAAGFTRPALLHTPTPTPTEN